MLVYWKGYNIYYHVVLIYYVFLFKKKLTRWYVVVFVYISKINTFINKLINTNKFIVIKIKNKQINVKRLKINI